MGQEAGESVKQLNSDNELLFDSAPEEDLESFDGVRRVEELENILGEIIDLWDDNSIVLWQYASPEEEEHITGLFDRAGAILANDSEEYPG